MKRLFVVFALLGRLFAQTITSVPCAEHNIYLSEGTTTISTSGAARCTAGRPSGSSVTYSCPPTTGAGMAIWGFDIQSPCVTNSVAYAVAFADTSSSTLYDLGLYYVKGPNATPGQLMVHTGPLPGTNFTQALNLATKPWTAGSCSIPCTLPAGQYALALETNCQSPSLCAQLYGDDNHGFMYLFDVWFGGSTGTGLNGAGLNPALLPAGCTPQNSCTVTMNSAMGLPASISPVVTDPTLAASGCSNGCPKPPAILIF